METVLIVVLVVTIIYLTWRLVSDRRTWQPERSQLQFKIDLANRLLERDHTIDLKILVGKYGDEAPWNSSKIWPSSWMIKIH